MEQEIERLRKQVHEQETRLKKYERLVGAVRELLKWAEYDGIRYCVGRKPIEDLKRLLDRWGA